VLAFDESPDAAVGSSPVNHVLPVETSRVNARRWWRACFTPGLGDTIDSGGCLMAEVTSRYPGSFWLTVLL